MKLRRSLITLFALSVAVGSLSFFAGTAFAADPCPTCLINPLAATVNSDTPIQSLSAIFINALFGIAGSIALAMFVWGGMLWLTSTGNEKQVEKGKAIFQWTTLGIIMMFAAYALVTFLFSNLGTAPAGAGGTGTGAGGAGGSGTAPAPTTAFCCVDYGNNTIATVTSKGACTGGKKEFVSDPCDKVKFCPAAPAQGYDACDPFPVSSQCLAGGSGYKSLADCMLVEKKTP